MQLRGTIELDRVFGALSDPTRRAILQRLTRGDATVAELTEPFAMTQPAISRHLKVLERAGLITRSRIGTARLSHLQAEPLREAAVWLVSYRDYWTESFERLDEVLAELQDTERSEPDATGKGTGDDRKEREDG